MMLEADILWEQNGTQARACFSFGPGITALIGPSGAGKTTLARLLAGLETPTGGTIRIRDQFLFNRKKSVNLPAAKRSVALVAQETSLFPHLSVAGNIGFAPTTTEESVLQAANAMGCQHLFERRPEQLSGGEKRRVAIARALASSPALIILDEPMTGLDPKARAELLPYFARMAQNNEIPILLISHQLEDLLSIADDAVLMANGQTLTQGPLEQVVRDPRCAVILGLSDAGQLVRGEVTGQQDGLTVVQLGKQELYIAGTAIETGSSITLRMFASDISLSTEKLPSVSILNQLDCVISSIEPDGDIAKVGLEIVDCGLILESRVTSKTVERMKLATNQSIIALIKAVSVKDCRPAD